ncbi:MAG: PAS domain S-box protein [Treponema sp.]|nr:PAS domain S-box protein [Treponema sp.]
MDVDSTSILLAETERKFRLAFENSPIGIILTSLEGHLRMANKAFCRMLDRSTVEVTSVDFVDLIRAEDVEISREMARRLLKSESPSCDYRVRYIHRDGRDVWADVSTALVRDALDEPDFFISHITDISEKKRQEEELRDTRNRYVALLNSIGEGFCYVDEQEIVRVANPSCGHVLGLPQDRLIGMSFFRFLDAEGRAVVEAENRRRARGESSEYTLPIIRADGNRRLLRVNAAPLAATPGDYIGASVIFRDITEEVRASEALNELVRRKETLMRELQHRVKNSLSIASSLIGIAMGELSDAKALGVLEDTRSRINSMGSIYERLYLTESVESLDFGTYLEGLAKSIFEAFSPDPARIALDVEVEHVELDTKRAIALGLIVNELFTNAVKYAFPGDRSGTVRVGLERAADIVKVEVSDDGIGIDPALAKRSTSMGMSLIKFLVEKELAGSMHMDARAGTSVSVEFKL